MKNTHALLVCSLALLTSCWPLVGQVPRESVNGKPVSAVQHPVPSTPLRREALRLIRDDATKSAVPAAPAEPATAAPVGETAGEVVALAPFVVREDRPPDFRTPRETPTQQFFRTGTLAERVGNKVTTQLWIRGDSGVMLSFRW